VCGGRLGESLTGRRRWLGALALSLYALLTAISPALHHDVACHVKSPAHCDACMANPLASRAEASKGVDAPAICAAGETPVCTEAREHRTPVPPTSGRAPPA
jgi:hypothetical protein